jgi:integrase
MASANAGRIRITKKIVDGLAPSEIRWDLDVRGFGVRRQRQARKYVLKTRLNGRQRWFTIGEHGSPWTVDTARKQALRLLGDIHKGADLSALRSGSRSEPTMGALCDRYLTEHADQHKKASSAALDGRNIENHILPLLGSLLVSQVSRADIDAFKRAVHDGKTAPKDRGPRSGHRGGAVVSGGPGAANRCLALLSKMFNLAERWGLRHDGSNPVRHVEKYAENRIERYLSEEELARLAGALSEAEKSEAENPFVIAAIRLLLFTGARLGEILNLKWEYVDLDRSVINLPDSKTGEKQIYLNSLAQQVVTSLPRIDENPYVIVGRRQNRHLVNITKAWYRIRKAAGIEDVRIHDLRHSFASVAVSGGLTLPMIGKLLGHKKSTTTERYAHLADDPVRAANEEVARLMGKSFGSGATPK